MVSKPTNPYIIGFYDTPGSAQDVYSDGVYMYVSDSSEGLRVIDISEPSNLKEVAFYDTQGSAMCIDIVGNYIYVADYSGGLCILRLISEPPCTKGDVNGDGKIGSNDAILALRIAAGMVTPNLQQQCAADVNDDGSVRANDAIMVLQMAAGMRAPAMR